ncbi:MAG: hypothetical protein AVDCRST_MAG61-589 [uncultured Friedmanniella sp.]|uniref:Uncharacterized protein n=1 Tax=uncultured Friedmanniella sp. TaxID=335381 RepID=A0A6J4K575_9ACTN|nr:hypothetical protein [uncultured Friedmanniella sp.]CAA9295910.1 MAG: hypothetical protein AVDCRST_MAG61-589 [uncultured Friedmanniella sp.]
MSRPSEDDRAAIDRAFAAMVESYHLTADRPDVAARDALPTSSSGAGTDQPEVPAAGEPDAHWADNHPLFSFPAAPAPAERPEPVEDPSERYVPEPLPPLDPPAVPALLGWLGIGWAALVVLAAAFGVSIPSWAGWAAVLGFLGGFALLVSRLPRERPPGAGDGAVL